MAWVLADLAPPAVAGPAAGLPFGPFAGLSVDDGPINADTMGPGIDIGAALPWGSGGMTDGPRGLYGSVGLGGSEGIGAGVYALKTYSITADWTDALTDAYNRASHPSNWFPWRVPTTYR